MKKDPELRPVKPKERDFIECVVRQGLPRAEALAFVENVTLDEGNRRSFTDRATRMFYLPHVQAYYQALMEEVRDREIKKSVWTKEVATQKLMKLIEHAENDIYDENKQLTMGRLNAIILPAKELNLMHGFNQTNVNVEGCVVQICGEDQIPD